MKLSAILSCLCLIFHCTNGQSTEEAQKIVDEIVTITEKYNHTWETLNMDNVAKFHSDSSFRYYRNMKLSVANNEEFRKLLPLYLKGTKSWKIEVSKPVVQILSNDAAVIGFTGVAELITTDNKVSDAGTGAYTYIWKKINNEWKLVHIHESTK